MGVHSNVLNINYFALNSLSCSLHVRFTHLIALKCDDNSIQTQNSHREEIEKKYQVNQSDKMLRIDQGLRKCWRPIDEPGNKTCGAETPGNGEEYCSGLCPWHVLHSSLKSHQSPYNGDLTCGASFPFKRLKSQSCWPALLGVLSNKQPVLTLKEYSEWNTTWPVIYSNVLTWKSMG